MRRLLPLLLVAACLPVLRDPDDRSDDGAPATDDTEPADDGPPCDGTWSLDLPAVPQSPLQQAFTWEDAGVELSVEHYGSELGVRRGDDGCLILAPGVLRLRLVPSRCAARAARVEAVPTCSPACTRLEILDEDGQLAASDSNSTTGGPEQLAVAPARPFVELVVRSLEASICGFELDQAPLPEHLRPVETGALF